MIYGDESRDVTDMATTDSPARLMHDVRNKLRVKHYSLRTEQAYVAWIRRFILATGRRHPVSYTHLTLPTTPYV